MYDVLIKGGRVIDGTGSPWRKADVGVSDKSIKKIGLIPESDAERVIDARGLVVSPGWIDIHIHADHTVLGNPACLSYAHQGITTVTMGNCGLSMYPLTPEHKEDLIEYMLPFTYGLQIDWDWSTMDEFLARLDAVSLNMVPFIGHGSIRIATMGFEDRPPTEDESESMKKLLVDAMESGAHGMSTGLGYPPGLFTGEKELVDLMNVIKEYGGLYSTHMRDNETNLDDTIRLGKITGVPIQISHIGYSCGHQRQLKGRHESTTLRKIDMAPEIGITASLHRLDTSRDKVLAIKKTSDWVAVINSLSLCLNIYWFGGVYYKPLDLVEILNAVTGWDYTVEEFMKTGERINTLCRCFNVREGITRRDDTLPRRFMEPLLGGPTDGQAITEEELDSMLNDYYSICGWDVETGIPTKEKLETLGLDFA